MKKTIFDITTKKFTVVDDPNYNIDELMDIMQSFSDDSPKVGIFWYDIGNKDLFGIMTGDANKYIRRDGKSVYPKLHAQVWKKEHYRELAKCIPVDQQKFKGNYTTIPRGRINMTAEGKFEVYVGSWIQKYEDSITPLIKLYFNIENFTYVIDSHWELGHGFSGDVDFR